MAIGHPDFEQTGRMIDASCTAGLHGIKESMLRFGRAHNYNMVANARASFLDPVRI